MDNELYRFKREINLIAYATNSGYVKDKRESSKSCIIMRKGNSKIGISTTPDGHDIFYDYHKEKGGSIIDFVKHETGKNLGQIRQELRPWIGLSKLSIEPMLNYSRPIVSKKNRQEVMMKFRRIKTVKSHKYLEDRFIKKNIIRSDRFFRKIYIDDFGNVVFPHYDHHGICGYAIRNQNFKGFSQGGEKGLWFSNYKQDDNQIVICESAIDALSYHQLKGDSLSCYFSIDGELSQKQLMLIGNLISKNQNKKIILAFDNDHAGKKYVSIITKLYEDALNITSELPEKWGQDWNNVLNETKC